MFSCPSFLYFTLKNILATGQCFTYHFSPLSAPWLATSDRTASAIRATNLKKIAQHVLKAKTTSKNTKSYLYLLKARLTD